MTRDEAKAICAKRILSGQHFTFNQLFLNLEREMKGQTAERFEPFRVADAQIQSFRKKGLIDFTRDGRVSIWSLTDAGKQYAKEQANG